MTREDWLAATSASAVSDFLTPLPDRRLHLLTAAFLGRVWDDLPSHHTRLAVEATEKYARGLLTVYQLARLRTSDTLETAGNLWLSAPLGPCDDPAVAAECDWCPTCAERAIFQETAVARNGYILGWAKAGVRFPGWIAAKAALYARELAGWAAEPGGREAAVAREQAAQFDVLQDVLNPIGAPERLEPHWLTGTVVRLARVIRGEQDFTPMPILADALEDAGCADELVLDHCRGCATHSRGCWVIDLLLRRG